MGKLIIIEGTDGSGKQTQTTLLYENLKNMGYKVKKISFPNYESNACYPVKMYLTGEFGKSEDISYYASSSFYAIDRYASFKKDWESFYNSGGIVISDRYTISNIIHQANRINDEDEFNNYCDWLLDFEWIKFGLPKPDLTIFLDVPYIVSNELMKNRLNKITGKEQKDILEADENQKLRAYSTAKKIAGKYDFSIINCVENDKIKSIDKIQSELLEVVKKVL
ncbi:dTMP kinase [Oceanivirga salmonicida]|uniref:dTMP kinase n=1 Tax=Oceanivirga salmonicida TaxID=1769291 RepID=UPI00082B0537|nr:deoxynucleoside kinase [Oceanivirga salmonicida]